MTSKLTSLAAVLTGTVLLSAVVASPAQAFKIGGGATSSQSGQTLTVDFDAPAAITDSDGGLVTALGGVTVADLVLDLSSGTNIAAGTGGLAFFEDVSNAGISNFITGFLYNGVAAAFDLAAGADASVFGASGSLFSFDVTFDGVIRDASTGATLAEVMNGTFSTSQNSTTNDFSMSLPTPAQAVPTPAMLPGLVGMGMAFARKRKQQAEVAA